MVIPDMAESQPESPFGTWSGQHPDENAKAPDNATAVQAPTKSANCSWRGLHQYITAADIPLLPDPRLPCLVERRLTVLFPKNELDGALQRYTNLRRQGRHLSLGKLRPLQSPHFEESQAHYCPNSGPAPVQHRSVNAPIPFTVGEEGRQR